MKNNQSIQRSRDKIIDEEYKISLQRELLYRAVLKEYCEGDMKHANKISVNAIANGDSLFIPHIFLRGIEPFRYITKAERPDYIWISNVNNVKKDDKGRASIENVIYETGYLHPDSGTSPGFSDKLYFKEDLEVYRLELNLNGEPAYCI